MASAYDEQSVYASINGVDVTGILAGSLTRLAYTEYANGGNDMLTVEVENADGQWLREWYPRKGDIISAGMLLTSEKSAQSLKYPFGDFSIDEIHTTGDPASLCMECVSSISRGAFAVTRRFKSWERASIEEIAKEISIRHSLRLTYSADEIIAGTIEQEEPDSAFLYKLCSAYGLSMKAFGGKLIVYDQTDAEQKDGVDIAADDFLGDDWEIIDGLLGTYTGARVNHMSPLTGREISAFAGFLDEGDPAARVLRISEAVSDTMDARRKAVAAVNRSNEKGVVLRGTISVTEHVFAGSVINLTGLGKLDGRYYVDTSAIVIGADSSQEIVAHKCHKRLTA